MIGFITDLFDPRRGKKEPQIFHTLTYYVPAPPSRQSGYRETQFDQLLSDYLNKGFQLVEMKTIPHQSPQQNGFWLLCVLSSTSAHPILPLDEETEEKDNQWEYQENTTELEVE